MPEGDSVFVAATKLERALKGHQVIRSDFRVPRHATADLVGKTITDVTSRGKHLLFRFDGDITLHTHFKMDGAWDLYRPGARWRSPGWQVRVVLYTKSWVAVGTKLPVVELLPTSEEGRVLGHLGPDPLRNWDEEEALARFTADPKRAVGDVLLDQRVIAGLGNVFRCEICFLRGLHPEIAVGGINDPGAVVALAARLVQANREIGKQVTTGDLRRGNRHWVYGRNLQPCRRCGEPVQRLGPPTSEERVLYWCARCQPVKTSSGNQVTHSVT